MENITVNITGEVNIIFPNASASEDLNLFGIVELKSDDDLQDGYFVIDPGANEDEEGYDESEIQVLFCRPGEKAELMCLLDALDLMQESGCCNKLRRVPTFDLVMAYNGDAVITVGKNKYLLTPAIIYYRIDDELFDLRYEDSKLVKRVMEERTVQLSTGNASIPAFML